MGDGGCPLLDRVNEYLRGRVARGEIGDATARNQRYILTSFARCYGNRPVSQTGQVDIERWLAQPRRGGRAYSAYTQRSRRSAVRSFTAWLTTSGHVKRDPGLHIKRLRVPEPVPVTYERSQVCALLTEAAESPRDRLIILLGAQMYLRCAEIARLDLGDFRSGTVLVHGKGGKQRVLPVVAEVREALDAYLVVRGMAPGPLIQSEGYGRTGLRLLPATVGHVVSQLARRSGVKRFAGDGIGAHGLRKTGISRMVERGADVQQVRQAAGWADLSSAKHYFAHRAAEGLRPAMEGDRYGDAEVIDIGREASA